jgi:outer membrane immunogenic protein
MIRLLAIGLVLVLAIAGGNTVWAADLPEPGPVVAQPFVASAPFANWTGCFVGGNGGIALANWGITITAGGVPEQSANGIAGGGQVGCDYQVGNWVIGIQALGDGTGGVKTNLPLSSEPQLQETWFAAATGRIGYTIAPAFLPYVRGGAGWAGWAGQEGPGWTVGAGIEWKFLPTWSAFFEYDYLGFSARNVTLTGTSAVTANTSLNTQAILLGLNYRFDFGAPVTTRY